MKPFTGWKAALALAALAWLASPDDARAQGAGRRGLPFQSFYSRPVVSPYTMLGSAPAQGNGGPNSGGGVNAGVGVNPLIYQQLIQPQIQQQEQQVQQIQQGRQLGRLQNQVQQIERSTTARQVNEMIRSTGHRATFQNLSHFYPNAR